ncbi:putative quaternary amine uptake ABC transporter (QAT) family, periplasmic substrate-binding protein [Crocosphaera subtropica ATCC 51142]|uniref:Quaternary amine uptake ABC transporter (QAT) family, periplasmic substrate-binding protein n=1 Tax=Crocosphaera subtropica (strain ATCC 51142 / BH68) TaxID=43989 RepID=B1WZA8_CROS5|nr:glycine betaine ABC transporter substrate-binding protein [Crocosphaera subtropica]ACB49474.1 putative quaternary amine uptake ABC transporter (QAT) family, periplasmic substrate-binding protein [Crocosphaera subtropica ATCC 51142]
MNLLLSIPPTSVILLRTGEHITLVLIAMIVATGMGIPLGIIMSRYPKLANPILLVTNAVQTIPSLALFGFLITVPFLGGIGKRPAIIALILYALLPIIKNTYIGITQIRKGVKEAGKSLGLTPLKILFLIELPLALKVILGGVRIAAVICVGIATIAAAIGGGGLGVFIFRGLSTVDNTMILAGAIPSAIIALLVDWGLGWLENNLTQTDTKKKKNKQKVFIFLFAFVSLIFIVFSLINKPQKQIVIGSKNFTEQIILGEMIAQQIENNSNLTVDRRFNLGGTFICHEAVKAQEIDGYVEYTGTAFTAILERKPVSNPNLVYGEIKEVYNEEFKLEVMPSLGFENTYAILIRGEDAKQYNIETISDVAQYTPEWTAGFSYEFLAREDGYSGLSKTYDLQFAQQPKTMELGLMYRALAEKNVDLVAGNSTDGLISVLDLYMLKDNKNYFPPYEAVPVFNQETLKEHPNLSPIIQQLSGQISSQEMQQLNYLVDHERQSVNKVVEDFLNEKNLT